MEKEREISKLIRVLNQIVHTEKFSAWNEQSADISKFSATQYNRVFARLKELEPSIEGLFVEIAEDSNPRMVRMAARELAGYFEDEIAGEERKHPRHHRKHCGTKRVVVGFSPFFGKGRCA